GCQALEDAATLAAALRATDGVDEALARYQRVRRRRVRGVVGRSRLIGQAINSIAPAVSERLIRASRLIPDQVVMTHLTHIAGRDAGRLQLNQP
ncbi:MAG: FAD-binding monooxygenase, partial [Gordonia sp. (in: high G+C Gram-positive bacteria)]